ncbi:MAG TPA: MGMT family protein [Bryobacteraceae bacterium]|nr:MGMT family protein [Bryobacteraceae bacterium]
MCGTRKPIRRRRVAIWVTTRSSRWSRGCAARWRGTARNRPALLSTIRDTIRTIPKGKVATYGDVASAAGFPGRARQVVWALRGARGLPWHRVVGAGGKIMLPGENGLEQRLRLETEGVAFRNGRVWMEKHQHKFK